MPVRDTRVVGIEEALKNVGTKLASKSRNRITIIGPPGSGRSRLLNEVENKYSSKYRFFRVSLHDVHEQQTFINRILASCEIVATGLGGVERLERCLAANPEPTVLCLDDTDRCEEFVVDLQATLLAVGARIIHTQVVRASETETSNTVSLTPLSHADGCALLSEATAHSGVVLSRQETAEIVSLLGGTPLEILSVAGTLSVVGVAQIKRRLLRGRRASSSASHLNVLLESWQCLSKDARLLCHWLCLFQGPVSSECAEQNFTETDVVLSADELLSMGWLSVEHHEGSPRWAVLGSIRQLVSERNENKLSEEALAYLVAWATRHADMDPSWWSAFGVEGRVCVAKLREAECVREASKILTALLSLVSRSIPLIELLAEGKALASVTELEGASCDHEISRLSVAMSRISTECFCGEDPIGWARKACDTAQNRDEKELATVQLASALFNAGRRDEARRVMEPLDKLTTRRTFGFDLAITQHRYITGQFNLALEAGLRARDAAIESDFRLGRGNAEALLGFIHFDLGHFSDSELMMGHALQSLSSETESMQRMYLGPLPALLAIESGDFIAAAKYANALRSTSEQVGSDSGRYFSEIALAQLARAQGKPDLKYCRAAKAIAIRAANPRALAQSDILVALGLTDVGRWHAALERFGVLLRDSSNFASCPKMASVAEAATSLCAMVTSGEPIAIRNEMDSLLVSSLQHRQSFDPTSHWSMEQIESTAIGGFPYFSYRSHVRAWCRAVPDRVVAGRVDEYSLIVERTGRRAVVAGRGVVDLSRKRTLRSILLLLMKRRLETPGLAISVDEIARTVWKDDQSMEHSLRHRVHTSINRLRKLLFDERLVSSAMGYYISEDTNVKWVDTLPAK